MSSLFYGHFVVTHTKIHHRMVSTPLDPNSSHENESYYQFLRKSIYYGFTKSWEFEKK